MGSRRYRIAGAPDSRPGPGKTTNEGASNVGFIFRIKNSAGRLAKTTRGIAAEIGSETEVERAT